MHVFQDQLDFEPQLAQFATGRAAGFSIRGPHRVTSGEDCAALIGFDDVSGILVVADGLGGLPAGDVASRLAIDELARSLRAGKRQEMPLRAAILDGFEAANRVVLEQGVGSATTLAVVEIQAHCIRPYHVGDSMILAIGQRGKIKLETVSHSPVGYAVAAGFLDGEEAMHHEERHYVSNMIGSTDMHITIGSSLELAPRDTVVVASDGLIDNLHLSEIVERVRKGPIVAAAQRLAEDSLARMTDPQEGQPSKADDLSAIVYRRQG